MNKSELKSVPEYFRNYIDEIEDTELLPALIKYGPEMFSKELHSFNKIGENIYEENKWTLKQILQHLIDTERVFLYRALCIARNDKTPLPSFDENSYADESIPNRRSFDELITEYDTVRNSAICLFESFTEEMLLRTGLFYGKEISVEAIGFVLAAHSFHHYKVIKEKYLPLAE
ncbi:MAG: DinB family protein [Bacteroidetes bacterium]|nr:DinB family protein [Bacteroidota bacterium]